MEKNFYDLELIKILEEHIENGDFQIIESNIYVDKVNANLPFKGSRVNFEQLEEYQRIAMMQSTNKEDDEKRKQRWIENKKREDNFYNSLDKGKSFTSGRMQTFLKERGRKVGEKINLSDEEYEEMYYYIGGGNSIYRNKKPQEKIAQEKDKKSTTNGYKYIIKPPERQKTDLEKVSDKLGLKAPVSPLSTTFSPQVNVNMGGVVIKNEADIEKTAEMSKQKIMAELRNFVQITK